MGGPQTKEKSPTHIQVRLYKLEVDFLIDSVKKWTVQALAPQGDVVALFHAFFFRRELLALSSCLHDSAAATRIPVVASPTDG